MDPAGLRKLEEEVKALRAVQKQIQEVAGQRETLMTQKTENELVMKELELIKGERPVYKLVGPVLVKQDLEEAKDTITKRLEYIAKQMADRETRLQALSIQAAAHQKIVCVDVALVTPILRCSSLSLPIFFPMLIDPRDAGRAHASGAKTVSACTPTTLGAVRHRREHRAFPCTQHAKRRALPPLRQIFFFPCSVCATMICPWFLYVCVLFLCACVVVVSSFAFFFF